ncbi:jg8426 [Pararge aegeria aegeria]|uniref:Jg8426 protein n=5 Tax=Pararge aegeria TaxID=116150 RepID=A0A8S4SN00_9NEOP|nr:jg8426 [Pararge aegeria aegeria]
MMAVHQESTPDLHLETLQTLSQLMLAQAQEVIAYKCIRDGMKDSMVAKVCSQCEELFMDTMRSLQKEHLRIILDRDWTTAVQAKQQTFRGLTQYYQAQVCRANKAVGEEIARLQIAAELLKTMREGSPVYELGAKAARQLAAAIRDNDFIYHERIPDARSLEPVPRAPVAQALPLQDRWSPKHKDLFEKLVPMPVHQAMQASSARRADIVNAEINKLREATQLLNSILASLNLPACIETEGSGGAGLPESIRSKAAAVRAEGGLPALQRLMAELPELLQRNREILTEAERMLREEAEADAALRAQFGARWTRTESDKLTEAIRANASKYSQIIDGAVRADAIVQQKFQQHKDNIELLSRSDGEIDAGVPNAPAPTGGDGDIIRNLRNLMTTVEEIKSERDSIESELKSATIDLREKFLSALAADGAVDEPAISAGALGAALAPLQRRAKESLERQETLAGELQKSHAALMESRGGASNRDEVLGKLCAAYDAYQDLTGNLKEGVKFYNDLTQLLVAFQNKVSDFCFARKTEKDELLKDLTQEASRSAQRPAPAPPQHYQDAVNEPVVAKKDPPPRPPPPSAGPAAPPAAAAAAPTALPYPQQPQGMPIPYGVPASPYPVYAPMPALYNPYATLPYPHHSRVPPGAPYQPYQYPQHPAGYPQPPPAGYNPYQQH